VGTPAEPPPVKPIVGILAATPELVEEARGALVDSFGTIDLASEPKAWAVSDYYAAELGERPWRQYVAHEGLDSAEQLATRKLWTNEMEGRWLRTNGRAVNLDPGYVDLQKLVLASTKDAAQRIYLGHGIFAESTLRFVGGRFEPWPFTYPDYADDDALEFFTRVRARYRVQLRARRRPDRNVG
jgi:hypothetical protein